MFLKETYQNILITVNLFNLKNPWFWEAGVKVFLFSLNLLRKSRHQILTLCAFLKISILQQVTKFVEYTRTTSPYIEFMSSILHGRFAFRSDFFIHFVETLKS